MNCHPSERLSSEPPWEGRHQALTGEQAGVRQNRTGANGLVSRVPHVAYQEPLGSMVTRLAVAN